MADQQTQEKPGVLPPSANQHNFKPKKPLINLATLFNKKLIAAITIAILLLASASYFLIFSPDAAYYRGKIGLGPKIAFKAEDQTMTQKDYAALKEAAAEFNIDEAALEEDIKDYLKHAVIAKQFGVNVSDEDVLAAAKAINPDNTSGVNDLSPWDRYEAKSRAVREKLLLAVEGNYEGRLYVFPVIQGLDANSVKLIAEGWRNRLVSSNEKIRSERFAMNVAQFNTLRIKDIPIPREFGAKGTMWRLDLNSDARPVVEALGRVNDEGFTRPSLEILIPKNETDPRIIITGYYYFV